MSNEPLFTPPGWTGALDAPQSAPDAPSSAPPNGRKPPKSIAMTTAILGVAVLVVLGLGAVLFFKNRDSSAVVASSAIPTSVSMPDSNATSYDEVPASSQNAFLDAIPTAEPQLSDVVSAPTDDVTPTREADGTDGIDEGAVSPTTPAPERQFSPVVVDPEPSSSTTTRAAVTSNTGYTCADESTLKSISGDTTTTATFVNHSSDSVSVYWLDYSGTRVLYNTLGAGASYTQQTYVTHPWVVTDSSGQCLTVEVAEAGSTTVTVS